MNSLVPASLLALAFLPSNASAWVFSLFPTARLSGDTCLKDGAKAGDTFQSVNGNIATVKSVHGTSLRCTNPNLPILATVEYGSAAFSSKAGMSLPDGYSQDTLTALQRFNGLVLFAKNNTKGAGVNVTAIKRSSISDMEKYAARVGEDQAKRLDDVQQSGIDQLVISDMKSWRFETQGRLKTSAAAKYTYLITILEGDNDVVVVNAWAPTGSYDMEKEELKQIATTVTGIAGATGDIRVAQEASKPQPNEQEPNRSTSDASASTAVPPKWHSALSPKINGTFVRFVNEAAVGGTQVYTFEVEDCSGEKKVAWLGDSGLMSNNRAQLGLPVPARVPNDRMPEVSAIPDKPYIFRFRWSHTSGPRNLDCDVTMAFVPRQDEMYEAVYRPVKDGCTARVDKIVSSTDGYRRVPEPSARKTPKQCKGSLLW